MTAEDSIPLASPLSDGAPATVLALHCGESAVRPAFDELLARLSDNAVIDRVTLPGGAWWLARAAELSEGRVKRLLLGGRVPVRDAVEAVLGARGLREVILLGHQGCAWYDGRLPHRTPGDLIREQGADMFRARAEIQRWAPRSLGANGWIIVRTNDGASARHLF